MKFLKAYLDDYNRVLVVGEEASLFLVEKINGKLAYIPLPHTVLPSDKLQIADSLAYNEILVQQTNVFCPTTRTEGDTMPCLASHIHTKHGCSSCRKSGQLILF